MRKKMGNLLGIVDHICFKIFNIGNLKVDIKHKSAQNLACTLISYCQRFFNTQRTPILIKYSSFVFRGS